VRVVTTRTLVPDV